MGAAPPKARPENRPVDPHELLPSWTNPAWASASGSRHQNSATSPSTKQQSSATGAVDRGFKASHAANQSANPNSLGSRVQESEDQGQVSPSSFCSACLSPGGRKHGFSAAESHQGLHAHDGKRPQETEMGFAFGLDPSFGAEGASGDAIPPQPGARAVGASSHLEPNSPANHLQEALNSARQQLAVADQAEARLKEQLAGAHQESADAAAAASNARREADGLREENERLKAELNKGTFQLISERIQASMGGLSESGMCAREGSAAAFANPSFQHSAPGPHTQGNFGEQ